MASSCLLPKSRVSNLAVVVAVVASAVCGSLMFGARGVSAAPSAPTWDPAFTAVVNQTIALHKPVKISFVSQFTYFYDSTISSPGGGVSR